MATTIGESISRVRGILKASNEDSFLTDRSIYSIISKYAKKLIEQEQRKRKLMSKDDLFIPLPFVELEEVNKIEANCIGIKSTCTILRTVKKLPEIMNGSTGPLIRKVYSIDGSFSFEKTTRSNFINIANSSTFKYNNMEYYWFSDGRLYFPSKKSVLSNLGGVMVEALWEDSLDLFCTVNNEDCKPMQELMFPFPDSLFATIEQMAEQEFGFSAKVPTDGADDGQNILR